LLSVIADGVVLLISAIIALVLYCTLTIYTLPTC